ncbi:MAG TPA: prolyl oligopeptidase family serine peptidase [Candidatus Dormibacteraeota bacterium]
MPSFGGGASPGPPPRFEQFFALRRFYFLNNLDFSPDGSQISYAHDGSGQFNLWASPVSGGWPQQLTAVEDQVVRHHAWTPNGFVLELDQGGAEQWQINLLPAQGGWPRAVTNNPNVQYGVGPVAGDGRRMLIHGNQERSTDVSTYLLDIIEGQYTLVADRPGRQLYPGGWHPDGRQVALTDFVGNTDQHTLLCDLESGELRDLTPHESDEFNVPLGFSADGRLLFNVTDRSHEFPYLESIELQSGDRRPLWQSEWGVEHAALSDDRRRIAFEVIEDGYSVFRMLDVDRGETIPVPELPRGVCLQFAVSGDGRRIGALIGTGTRTFDVYVADLDAGRVTRVTDSFLGGIPESELVEPELIRYPTFDGKQVPAWLYRPPDGRADGKLPVLLSIHGGPETQERTQVTRSSPFYQYLLSRGVAVLAPNIRGSTGYGKSYQKLIHRDWGGGDLKDVEHAACWLQEQPWVDPARIAVYGASYGGFATLSAATRLPGYWRCAIDLVGPADLVTFARNVPPFWRSLMKKWVGDPEDDHDFLLERSPITYVEDIQAPLMVLQGANDPRVVKSESDQMVERLRGLGREVEYHVFEDEGHDFSRRSNQLRAYVLIAAFLFRQFGLPVEAD